MRLVFARMRHTPRWLVVVWSVTALLAWVGLLASLPGYYQWFVEQPIRQQFSQAQILLTITSGVASLLCALVSLSLAVFLFLHKPGERGPLFVSFFLLGYGFLMSGPLEMLDYSIFQTTSEFAYRVQGVVFTAPMILLLLTFPNGVIIPTGFRRLVPLIFLLALVMAFIPIEDIYSLSSTSGKLVNAYAGILVFTAIGAQVYRYLRVSSPVERQQTKVVVLGIVIQFLLLAISSFFWYQSEIIGQLPLDLLAGSIIWWAAMLILPIALTVSVVRSRLWEIDVVIRRTIIYSLLSAVLALVYFSIILLLQPLFLVMIGHDSPLAIVLSTLAIASLFHPLRRSIQKLIDRRFFRRRYNAERALVRFQQGLRSKVHLEQVEAELSEVLEETLQPEWAFLWVRQGRELDG